MQRLGPTCFITKPGNIFRAINKRIYTHENGDKVLIKVENRNSLWISPWISELCVDKHVDMSVLAGGNYNVLKFLRFRNSRLLSSSPEKVVNVAVILA